MVTKLEEDDSEYVPSTSTENNSSEEDDSNEDTIYDSNEDSNDNLDVLSDNNITVIIHRNKAKNKILSLPHCGIQKKKDKYKNIFKKYNKNEKEYFLTLTENEKDNILYLENNLCLLNDNIDIAPLRFKLLKYNIPISTKNIILSKLEQFNNMSPGDSEYSKLSNWIKSLSQIPIDKYHLQNLTDIENITSYLINIRKSFDENIFGHKETKEQILRIIAQWISNPNSNGYVIGIQGSPGIGKTKLVKDGICKAMGYPMSFVSLGGISESCYLNGHNYTYEGSTYGKIVECLIKSKVMNPVFLFDELDKVSNTTKGDEIINTLIHITDPVQNDKYNDKFFEEIDINLSKSLMIFTYNDENAINPILKDRMITIRVPGYNSKEKFTLCKDYIIPELLPQYNMNTNDIIFEDELLKKIIELHSGDEGMRNLKRIINDILSWINVMKYLSYDGEKIQMPFNVSYDFYQKYSKKINTISTNIPMSMYT